VTSRFFCLASGPSLTAEDAHACLGRGTVIAVNDAYQLAPWAEYLYSSDWAWWFRHQGVPGFQGTKVCCPPYDPPPEWNVHIERDHRLVGPVELQAGWNSGLSAINLAAILGADEIILLGYDHRAPDPGQPEHFFGDHPSEIRELRTDKYQHFHKLADWTAQNRLTPAGVDVINCSRQTALTCFRRANLEDVL
jgi:hypothetical protein